MRALRIAKHLTGGVDATLETGKISRRIQPATTGAPTEHGLMFVRHATSLRRLFNIVPDCILFRGRPRCCERLDGFYLSMGFLVLQTFLTSTPANSNPHPTNGPPPRGVKGKVTTNIRD